jgi:hypothetical protein
MRPAHLSWRNDVQWGSWIRQASLLALSSLIGCSSIGPGTVPRDRFDYSSAVADSWKEQALLNIVKLRYMDTPVIVDVSQIVSGYSFQGAVSGTYGQNTPFGGFYSNGVGVQGIYTDRPTITYTPLTGQQYMKGLLTPIAPSSVLFMIQAGYAADSLMLLTLESINGLNNRSLAPSHMNPGDPEFFRAVELVRAGQRSGEIGMHVQVDQVKKETTLLTFHRRTLNGGAPPEAAELARLLRLDGTLSEYQVTYGMSAGGGSQIDMTTRSVFQMMLELAGTVEIPKVHLDDGSTYPVPPPTEGPAPLMHVHSGTTHPSDPFAAIQYQGYWFWIDRGDLLSKRTFAFLTAIFNFADTGKLENLPLITIPAQ